ncbi:Fluoride ion transporter CrcB, partial [Sideroxydans sp. CL21]
GHLRFSCSRFRRGFGCVVALVAGHSAQSGFPHASLGYIGGQPDRRLSGRSGGRVLYRICRPAAGSATVCHHRFHGRAHHLFHFFRGSSHAHFPKRISLGLGPHDCPSRRLARHDGTGYADSQSAQGERGGV